MSLFHVRFLVIILFFTVVSLYADGYLTVRTTPDGIEVWLDDNFVGDSPVIDKKLKSGRYSLKLVDPVQHSSTIEEIFIQDNENTIIEKTIRLKFGSLKVTSVPPGAQVSIATELGLSPISNDFMNPGKYRVEIRHPDKKYLPVVEEVLIPRGKSVSIAKTLEREKPFSQKDLWRLILGAGTVGGYVWAIIANGDFYENKIKYSYIQGDIRYASDETKLKTIRDKYQSAEVQRVLGIILGSACLLGLEIVAFF